MSNERLRAAMIRNGLASETLADRLQVDPKTVTRWLGGRLPHPQHRFAIATQLDQDEEYLWPTARRPEAGSKSAAAEIVAAYPFRADVDVAHWWTMITKAKQQIDLLGYTLYFLPQQHPQLIDVLREKCHNGCQIRIAIADPDSQYVRLRDEEEQDPITLTARINSSQRAFEPLLECGAADMRYQDAPLYNSIFRFDDEMFVTTHLYATLGNRAPLLHLRRLGPGGLFSRYASHFEGIWSDTKPMGEDRPRQPIR
jgi:transcriptional regulator with XRE-family HTH domain